MTIWPDEPDRFTLFQHDDCIKVRRQLNEALCLSCTVPTRQAYGEDVLIWGVSVGMGLATLCSNKMKSPEYVRLLRDHFIPSMDYFFLEGNDSFQDDNVRPSSSSNCGQLVPRT
ncbi:hypothetical protein AVEN_100730-1 [Araneus ventricosus]|uniref:Uncharacterized protein n=1 Tax=Araneus ventricosus TaxID=182803 RepID=A0A4Y2CUJ9_ARAVE|nr:hypothetical protein AVEN_100730-1 [Araneus ventricosus]